MKLLSDKELGKYLPSFFLLKLIQITRLKI